MRVDSSSNDNLLNKDNGDDKFRDHHQQLVVVDVKQEDKTSQAGYKGSSRQRRSLAVFLILCATGVALCAPPLYQNNGEKELQKTRALESGSSTGIQIVRIGAIILLVLFSAGFSGLTLGMMGLDTNQLKIVKEAGSPEERVYASRLWTVRQNGNLLLCTLLLGNVAVNALMSILMADLTNGIVGFLVSTAAITIFGEIMPQAFCSRYALYLGSKAVPIVKVIIALLFLLTKPLSMLLDKMLGEEVGKVYSKEEFDRLIAAHSETLSADRRRIMQGALKYGERMVASIMTPRKDIFALHSNDRLSFDVLSNIFEEGYSRVPVWDDEETHMVGLLYAKDLMLLTPKDEVPVMTVISFFQREYVPVVDKTDNLETVLKVLNETHIHFAGVRDVDDSIADRDPVYTIVGCVTLEDIMEEILQMEVEDEFDTNEENRPKESKAPRSAKTKMDRQRLKILDISESQNNLPRSMVRAIASTLLEIVPALRKPDREGNVLTFKAVCALVCSCPVLRLSNPVTSRKQANHPVTGTTLEEAIDGYDDEPDINPESTPAAFSRNVSEVDKVWDSGGYILHRRAETRAAYIILEGSVLVTSGDDGITSVKRSFDILGERTLLLEHDKTYKTDFSARIISKSATIMKIQREDLVWAYRLNEEETKFSEEEEKPTPAEGNGMVSQGTFSSLTAIGAEQDEDDVQSGGRPVYFERFSSAI